MTPPATRPLQPKEEQDEGAVAVEAKWKTNKKNKSKKPGCPPRENQEVVEAAPIPGGVNEGAKTAATAVQVPEQEQEQQSLVTSAPPDGDVQGANGVAAEATTIVKPESETSTLFFFLLDQDDEEDEHEKDDDDEEKPDDEEKEEFGPDEAFLLEGASTILVRPIFFKLMTSAVLAMDTQSYQKEALEEWVERCKAKGLPLTSPLTNAPMGPQMMNNQAIRGLVLEHIEAREQSWLQQVAEKNKNKNKNI